jgi:hypothetical protein
MGSCDRVYSAEGYHVRSRLSEMQDRPNMTFRFAEELQTLLSSAATQKRIGESKVISARAEVDAAKLMRQVTSSPIHSLRPANNRSPTGR